MKVFSHPLLCLLLCPLLVLAIPWSRWIALLASWQIHVALLLFWTPEKKNTSYYHYGLGCLYHHLYVSHEPGLESVIQRGLLPGLCPGTLYPCASAFTTGGATSLQGVLLGIRISTHTNCSLLPRISKTSHAGPMSTSSSPRSAVTVMVVGTLLPNPVPVLLNVYADNVQNG